MKKYVYFLFLVSVFLFRLPSFYLFPFVRNPLITSQAIGRILSCLVFLWNTYDCIKYRKKSLISPSFTTNFILLLFFIESISIIPAVNVAAFLERYKDIFIGATFFINGYIYKDKLNEIFLVMLIALPISIGYELLMYFFPGLFITLGSIFIYDKHFSLVLFNLLRSRTYTETFNELLLPFLFYLIKQNKTKQYLRIIFYILIALIILGAYLSNWRIRILMALFGCVASLAFFHKKNLKTVLFTLFLIVFFGFLVDFFSTQMSNLSFISRFTDDDLINNTSMATTIDFRKQQILNAIEQSKRSFLGVGLGNYFDNLQNSAKQQGFIQIKKDDQVALEFVHNNFGATVAETGIAGLVIFTILIIKWGISDLRLLTSKNESLNVPILAFWTLFIFGLFNPVNIGAYQILFLLMRSFLN